MILDITLAANSTTQLMSGMGLNSLRDKGQVYRTAFVKSRTYRMKFGRLIAKNLETQILSTRGVKGL
eukprot:scaffold3378_cov104-Cylindrotheca_fusiformis.AAC.4